MICQEGYSDRLCAIRVLESKSLASALKEIYRAVDTDAAEKWRIGQIPNRGQKNGIGASQDSPSAPKEIRV